MTLTLDELRTAVAGGTAGIRARFELESLGGPGDKVAPPTYGVENSATTKYAGETRRIGEKDVLRQPEVLVMVRQVRCAVTPDHFGEALAGAWNYESALPGLGWDARGERLWPLWRMSLTSNMAGSLLGDGTVARIQEGDWSRLGISQVMRVAIRRTDQRRVRQPRAAEPDRTRATKRTYMNAVSTRSEGLGAVAASRWMR